MYVYIYMYIYTLYTSINTNNNNNQIRNNSIAGIRYHNNNIDGNSSA